MKSGIKNGGVCRSNFGPKCGIENRGGDANVLMSGAESFGGAIGDLMGAEGN
jgi:hypothetical protein